MINAVFGTLFQRKEPVDSSDGYEEVGSCHNHFWYEYRNYERCLIKNGESEEDQLIGDRVVAEIVDQQDNEDDYLCGGCEQTEGDREDVERFLELGNLPLSCLVDLFCERIFPERRLVSKLN